jgi:hypothetical protein
MRGLSFALLVLPLSACGNDPAGSSASASATESATDSSTAPDPTTTPDPGTSSSGDAPTGGSAGNTESGTTSTSSTSEATGDSTAVVTTESTGTSTTGGETGTTMGVLDTGSSDTGTTAGEGTSGSDGSSSTGGEDTMEPPEPCACPDLEVPLDDGIFVLSITAELWKFFPETNEFLKLGDLTCPLPASTFSMAVDRLGNAWVQYAGGDLRTVPVTDVGACNNPGYQVGQMGITNFGMAFVSNSAADACDRIYGVRASGIAEGNAVSDFFAIDPVSLDVLQIGKSDYGTAEVTGTGDGRTFLFAGANPAKLVEINKATGAKLDVTPLAGVELGSAWAFAHFAGDFYFFTNSKNGPGSEVTHIDYDDSDMNGQQQITEVVANAPISIVGAGVSTCAPFAPQ